MKKMKLLLVQPPTHLGSITFGYMEPYALEVLATAIMTNQELNRRVDVSILDLRKISTEKALLHLKNEQIDMIGITGITIDVPMMLSLSKTFKNFFPSAKIVLGGHHATMMPVDLFDDNVDMIVRGPGQEVLLRILQEYLSGHDDYSRIKGVVHNQGEFVECKGWRDNIVKPPPGPSRGLVNHRYTCFGKRMSVVTTAQGCGSRCTFCACWPAMGGKYLTKDPEVVVAEIALTPEKYIFLGDDHTFGDILRAWEIAKLLKQRGIRKWYDGYCRADIIAENPDLLMQWAEAGMGWLTVGFEATSDEELKGLHKNSSLEINAEANRILQECGIVNYAHILVRPDFSRGDFRNIESYVKRMGIVEPVFPIQTPLPGTGLWRKYEDELVNMPRQFFDLAHPLTQTAMPIEEFYDEYLKLVGACFSYRRWFSAKLKQTQQKFGVGYASNPNELMAISLPVLMITLWMYKSKMTRAKIENFVQATIGL